jgi:hypothetical protein
MSIDDNHWLGWCFRCDRMKSEKPEDTYRAQEGDHSREHYLARRPFVLHEAEDKQAVDWRKARGRPENGSPEYTMWWLHWAMAMSR